MEDDAGKDEQDREDEDDDDGDGDEDDEEEEEEEKQEVKDEQRKGWKTERGRVVQACRCSGFLFIPRHRGSKILRVYTRRAPVKKHLLTKTMVLLLLLLLFASFHSISSLSSS